MEPVNTTYEQLQAELKEIRMQLEEANDTIEAIRTGQIDALIVDDGEGHQVYTLKTADQTYRLLIEKMNEGAVTLNRDGLILYSNTRFAGMIDLPLEKVIGHPFNKFVSASSAEKFVQLIESSWESDCKEEIELSSKRNTPLWCMLSCNTIDLDEGKVLSLILTDLSILKDAEKQLTLKNEQLVEAKSATEKLNNELEDIVKDRTNELFLSREHFKYLANNIPQMSWTNLPTGEVNYFNEQWYNYTGLTHPETKDWGWHLTVHPDDLPLNLEKFKDALQTGGTFEVETRYRRSDGEYRWHLNRAIPLRNEEGEIVFWVGTATDIEDQKRQMERKDEFIGIASHELRTPLTSVKGYLQLISAYKKEELPVIVKQYVTKANAALEKLQRLVNDLLDVSKIQAGRLEYALTPVNISALVKICAENAEHVYPANKFTIENTGDWMVNANIERLEQVLMNLISNAVKYAPDDKNILIRTLLIDNYVRVSVTDYGIGLSEEQKKRIFERFYRVEDKKYMTSGLGMGLYISAEIVRTHKGRIGVDGKLGKGSTFFFELPVLVKTQ